MSILEDRQGCSQSNIAVECSRHIGALAPGEVRTETALPVFPQLEKAGRVLRVRGNRSLAHRHRQLGKAFILQGLGLDYPSTYPEPQPIGALFLWRARVFGGFRASELQVTQLGNWEKSFSEQLGNWEKSFSEHLQCVCWRILGFRLQCSDIFLFLLLESS